MPDLSSLQSFMAEALRENPSVYAALKDKITENGVPFGKIIKPGVDCKCLWSFSGVVAGDAQSYDTFKELFDPIIEKCHKSWSTSHSQQPSDLDVTKIVDSKIDPAGKYLVSTCVRVARNLGALCFLPFCSSAERREVERITTKALLQIQGESQGGYLPLCGSYSYVPKIGGMPAEKEKELQQQDLVFGPPKDAFHLSSGFGKAWPDARGVFLSSSMQSGVRINEKEHLVFWAMQKDENIKEAFKRAYDMEGVVRESIMRDGYCFASSSRLGYISTTPEGLGTGLRVSAMLKIPLLGARPDFKDICAGLTLQVAVCKGDAFEVSNGQGLGKTEVEQVNAFLVACSKVVEAEQALEAGKWHEILPAA